MREVAVIGSGMTHCKSRWLSKTYLELAQLATKNAIEDAGIDVSDLDGGAVGIYNDIFEFMAIPESPLQGIVGLANKGFSRVTSGGATGIYTMYNAYNWVASGMHDVVLVLGVEKALDCYDFEAESPTPAVVQTIAYSWDPWFERQIGNHASSSYAQVIAAYRDEHDGDLTEEASAKVVELLCQQAQNNPYAQRLGEAVSAEQVLDSRYVIDQIRILETCVYTEGACALIFASKKGLARLAGKMKQEPIWITGAACANEPYFVGKDPKRHKVLHRIQSDEIVAREALKQARLTVDDIQVMELHDAFVPQLMITLAEMGVVPLGRANDLVNEGIIMPGGKLLLNPCGGLVFSGHFVGGSNMMSTWSIMREMKDRDLEHGLVHGTGASLSMFGGAMIFERRR